MASPRKAPEKLARVRRLLAEKGLAALVVTSADAHLSEYVAKCDKRREWITEFTGSAGSAVITPESALLWTDGRYYEQAEKQLSKEWELVRASESGAKTIPEYLKQHIGQTARVGINAETISIKKAQLWTDILCAENCGSCMKDLRKRRGRDTHACPNQKCISLIPIKDDIIDQVWETKPRRPSGPVHMHPERIAGVSSKEKIEQVRQHLKEKEADAVVLVALDEIAWLLNLRGNDVLYTPVFFAYLVVTIDAVLLFVQPGTCSETVRKKLARQLDHFEIANYNERGGILRTVRSKTRHNRDKGNDKPTSNSQPGKAKRRKLQANSADQRKDRLRFLLDPNTCGWQVLIDCMSDEEEGGGGSDLVECIFGPSPVKRAKAKKNEYELEGMRLAHIQEGVALCRFFSWMGGKVKEGSYTDEMSACKQLEEIRTRSPDYRGPSFETISAYGPNASVVHYSPTDETNKAISTDSLYLCDTGGQYQMGTTDMTRTLCFGAPSDFQKLAYSLVLEGHVQLGLAVFPQGTEPTKLDILARMPLWKRGMDYRHGTSHGLGAFLGVHEYPPLISSGLPPTTRFEGKFSPSSMVEGMVLSNEPGYYQPGEFGVRIENVMLSKVTEPENTDTYSTNKKWLAFETITMVPYQRSLIDKRVLSTSTVKWINEYHQTCYDTISQFLQAPEDQGARTWLFQETRPL